MTRLWHGQNTVLAIMGKTASGPWLETWISIDAFLVLAGACAAQVGGVSPSQTAGSVITSYVGVTGLCRRLAGDRCLPNILLHTNKWRGTCHWIIIMFFLICTSMVRRAPTSSPARDHAVGARAGVRSSSSCRATSMSCRACTRSRSCLS
jgi:amino acid transporter